MVKVNRVFLGNGEEVMVTGFARIKSKEGYIEAVTCKEAKAIPKIDSALGDTWVIPLKDFNKEFVPKLLEPGMKVQGVSMGKVIREYVVESVSNGKAVLKMTNGVERGYEIVIANADMELGKGGAVKGITNKRMRQIYGDMGEINVDYRLVTPDIERRMLNKSLINVIVNKLKCNVVRVGSIDLNGDPEAVRVLIKSIDELTKEIETVAK